MFVSGQIYFPNYLVRAILKTIPACLAFFGVKLNKWCSCMFVIKNHWFRIVINFFAKMLYKQALKR